jgi:polysaccharide export outer membrane protein
MSMDRVKLRIVVYALLVYALPAAGVLRAQGQPKPDPAKPDAAVPTQPTAPINKESGVGLAVDPNKYVIGPEDVIFINTWRERDFTMMVGVRPDGKITMPLIGEVQAGGQTPTQLTKDLIDKLSKYINNPDVTVIVQEVRSRKYYIDGEVNRPGSFPLVTPTTILEALSNAGGFHEFANLKRITLLRPSKDPGAKPQVYKFNYKEVTSGKKMDQNIYLENGDHIIVK